MSQAEQAPQGSVRVLHSVGHLLRGGIETWLYQTLPVLLSRGFEHHVLVRTAEEEPFTAEFREAGIPVLACPRFTNPFHYLQDLKKVVAEHGPYDILHVHGSSLSGLLTLALARVSGIPRTVVHSHNDVRFLLKTRSVVYRAYVHALLWGYRRLADRGLAASRLAAESMFGDEWQRDARWELLYCGVDCAPFAKPADESLRARLGMPEGAYVIGHVGRFHEQKNHGFLVEVVAAAAASDQQVHCLLIGDGPLREEVRAEIERRGLGSRFTFVPDTSLVAQYMTSAMDCFVFPSRYEGLGLAVVEAQAAGLPCLISDRVPPEAIVNEELVRVLPLEVPASRWAEEVLQVRAGGREPKEQALARVEGSQFNVVKSIQALQLHYRSMMNGTAAD
ncbi:MAG TPA: glycosyltransferase [Acidobacteriaceae bacterium]